MADIRSLGIAASDPVVVLYAQPWLLGGCEHADVEQEITALVSIEPDHRLITTLYQDGRLVVEAATDHAQ